MKDELKKELLQELLQWAMGEMRGKNKSMMNDHETEMKKVSVMADDQKGLEEGLDKAKDIISSGLPEEMDDEGSYFSDDEDLDPKKDALKKMFKKG